MATEILQHRTAQRPEVARAVGLKPTAAAVRSSIALAVVAAVASALTFFWSGVLTGPAVMNGSARGTGLIVLFVTVPALVIGMRTATRGSTRGLLVWAGAVAHVLYQSVLFLFATPFNDLFLLYVAMFGLAVWSVVALLSWIDVAAVRTRIASGLPARPIAIYVWVVAGLNALAWLGPILTALREPGPAAFLVGTGMTTNPIYVQDLAFWLPLMALAAWWLWRDRDRGVVLMGAMLTMWLIESVTVATDQWMGHQADPASNVATMGGVWLFVALTVIGVVPWAAFFRHVRR